MPTGQQYATNVPQTTLTGLINASATVASVNSSSGWPATPFTAILDIGTSSQEPVDVTNVTGTTWTITRAIDGTVGMTHGVGATVTHGDIGRDYRESRAHIDASTTPDSAGEAVHGLASGSAVVGTNDTQTLANKSLTSPQISGAGTNFNGTIAGTSTMGVGTLRFAGIAGANAQFSRLAGTNISGPPTANPFLTGDIAYDEAGNQWYCTAGGSPGTWVPVNGKAKIFESILSSTVSSLSASVPSWATGIEVVWTARTSAAVAASNLQLQFNSDVGTNYQWQEIQIENTTVTGSSSGGATTMIQIGVMPGANSTANYFGCGDFVVPNSAGSVFKTAVGKAFAQDTVTDSFIGTYGGQWASTAAITGLLIKPSTGSFVAGSSLTVYANS
jgi:hypothetical protein